MDRIHCIVEVADCPYQLNIVVFNDKCQRTQQGNLLIDYGNGGEKEYRAFGKGWKRLSSASNYKTQQFTTIGNFQPLSTPLL